MMLTNCIAVLYNRNSFSDSSKELIKQVKLNIGGAFFQSGIAFITSASTDAFPGACSAS
jgi:hypothetical protein